jgi:hypothetical protein
MSSLIDLVTSAVIFGILTLTIARVQSNINATVYENQFSYVTQTNSVELARQIEWDFAKIGHHVMTGSKILSADSTEIQFRADLTNTGAINIVRYTVGDTSGSLQTMNKRDYPLFREQDGAMVQQNWGLTYFKIRYYDADNQQIPPPITGSSDLARIHSINVVFLLESPEPVVTMSDTTWSGVAWEKSIVPRNLGNLNY